MWQMSELLARLRMTAIVPGGLMMIRGGLSPVMSSVGPMSSHGTAQKGLVTVCCPPVPGRVSTGFSERRCFR